MTGMAWKVGSELKIRVEGGGGGVLECGDG